MTVPWLMAVFFNPTCPHRHGSGWWLQCIVIGRGTR